MHESMQSFAPPQVKTRISTFYSWLPNLPHLEQWNIWWIWQTCSRQQAKQHQGQNHSNYYLQRQSGSIHPNSSQHTPTKGCPQACWTYIGGDRVKYPGQVTTWTADLITVKLHLNSIVSTPNGKFPDINISNFYLDTPLDWLLYAHIAVKYVPQQFIDEYNLASIITEGYLHLKVVKGMYGLAQAGILANKLLKTWLASHRYIECTHMPGLWKNVSRQTTFILWVDNFGIHYTSKDDAMHLIKTLQ